MMARQEQGNLNKIINESKYVNLKFLKSMVQWEWEDIDFPIKLRKGAY